MKLNATPLGAAAAGEWVTRFVESGISGPGHKPGPITGSFMPGQASDAKSVVACPPRHGLDVRRAQPQP